MDLGNLIMALFLTYYTMYLINITFNKRERQRTVELNKELDGYREIEKKTLEEQKKFITLKYPKKQKNKNKLKSFANTIVYIGSFVLIVTIYKETFKYFNIIMPLWIVVLIIIIFPIIFNYIFKKFNLQKGDDLSVYLR